MRTRLSNLVLSATLLAAVPMPFTRSAYAEAQRPRHLTALATSYRTATVDGVEVFNREAGPADGPVVLLLHGFTTSSHMFRNLIPALADRYHVIAPDYPGFGQSAMPDHLQFRYTFAHYATLVDGLMGQLGAGRYAMYVMDYGAPVGFRLALKHPERISALIVQNGNAYDEGLRALLGPDQSLLGRKHAGPAQCAQRSHVAGNHEVPVHGRREGPVAHRPGQLGA